MKLNINIRWFNFGEGATTIPGISATSGYL